MRGFKSGRHPGESDEGTGRELALVDAIPVILAAAVLPLVVLVEHLLMQAVTKLQLGQLLFDLISHGRDGGKLPLCRC